MIQSILDQITVDKDALCETMKAKISVPDFDQFTAQLANDVRAITEFKEIPDNLGSNWHYMTYCIYRAQVVVLSSNSVLS